MVTYYISNLFGLCRGGAVPVESTTITGVDSRALLSERDETDVSEPPPASPSLVRQRGNIYNSAGLPPGKSWFEPDPTGEWKEVGSDEICRPGLEFRLNLETGLNEARVSG